MNNAGPGRSLEAGDILRLDDDDVLYSGSDDGYYDSPGERRRRCEIEGRRFLQGRPMNIMSAQLKGPFDKESGWQNPWLGRSTAHDWTKTATATPLGHFLTRMRSNSPGVDQQAAGFTNVVELRKAHIAAAPPLTVERLTQSSSSHRSNSDSPRLHGLTINPHMSGDAWSRVQAWRKAIATQAEPVEATVTSPSRSKRPANSELLRSTLVKKTRLSGVSLSNGDPPIAIGLASTPRTGQRQDPDPFFSTPDFQSISKSRVSLDNLSGAVLDGSVAEQTNVSKAAQTLFSNSVEPDRLPTPTPDLSRAEMIVEAPVTPVRKSRPLSRGRQSVAASTPRGSEQNLMRRNVMNINAIMNNSTQEDKKNTQATDEHFALRPCATPAEQHVQSPLEFCTQADRSFQYRAKAPRINKRRALMEAMRYAQGEETAPNSSTSTETASESDEPAQEVAPQEAAPQDAAIQEAAPENEIVEKVSRETSSNATSAEQHIEVPLEDVPTSSSSTDGTSVMADEAADNTTAGIDGPTLIPSSTHSEQAEQQAAPPSTLRQPEKGAFPGDIGRDDVCNAHGPLSGLKYLILKPNSTPLKPVEGLVQAPSVDPESTKVVSSTRAGVKVQITSKDLVAVVDPVVLPTPQIGLGAKPEAHPEVETPADTPSLDQRATAEPANKVQPDTVLTAPELQSPWAKEVIHITGATPVSQAKRPTHETPIQNTIPSKVRETPHDSPIMAVAVQQSPWTKEIVGPALVDTVVDIPPLLPAECESSNRQGRISQGSSPGFTASQNPWVADEAPGDALTTADRRPFSPVSPHCLGRNSEVTPPPAIETARHSPIRTMAGMDTAGDAAKPQLPSTPTQQSSLPTPDLTTSIKSFRDFMSPSPEPRRRSKPILSSSNSRISKSQGRKSTLSKSRKDRAKRAHLRVSFNLPDEPTTSSPATNADPDETLDGAELPSREAESPSLVRKASTQAPSARPGSPPLELSQSELPAEGTRFSKFFRAQARKGPQSRRAKHYKPLLPSASQQRCGSPDVDAMAEAFIEADRAQSEHDASGDGDASEAPGNEQQERAGLEEEAPEVEEDPEEESLEEGTDDVTAVLDNLDDFLKSFDVDAELDKAKREGQRREQPQELGMGFPSMQDQMEIMGAGD